MGQRGCVSPQLQVAAYQFLRTSVAAFNSSNISDQCLQTLIRNNIVRFRGPGTDRASPRYVYQFGVPTDYFVMILEGNLAVS